MERSYLKDAGQVTPGASLVKVALDSVDLDEFQRAAIAYAIESPNRMASRAEIKTFFSELIEDVIHEAVGEYHQVHAQDEQEPEPAYDPFGGYRPSYLSAWDEDETEH